MAFSDEVLEKIFSDKQVIQIPIYYQATLINVIERILEEEEQDKDAN